MIGPAIIGGLTLTSKMPGVSLSIAALETCNTGAKLAEIPGTPCFYCYAKSGFYTFKNAVAAQARRLESLREAIADPAHGQRWSGSLGLYLGDAEYEARRKLKKAGKPSDASLRLYYADQAAQARCNAGARRILKGGDPEKESAEAQRLAKAAAEARKGCDDLKANDPAEAKRVARYISWDSARHFRWHDSGDLLGLRHMLLIDRVCRLAPTVAHWLPTQERQTVKRYMDHLKREGLAIPENLTIRISSPKLDQHILSKTPGVYASSVSTTGEAPAALCPAYTQGGTCGDCRRCWGKDALVPYPFH
jgi:hypothetical protein